MRELRQWIDLIDQLRQLRAREEFAYGRDDWTSIDQLAWANIFDIRHAHAIHGVSLHAKHTDTELTRDQLANELDATIAQGIDIVWRFLCVVEADDLTDDRNEVAHLEDTIFRCICNVETQALIDLEPSDTAIVKSLEIKEHTLNHLTSIVHRRQITWSQTAIRFDQRFVRATSSVFVECFGDVFNITSVNILKQSTNF